MSTQTITESPDLVLKLRSPAAATPAYMDELAKNGYCVVKNVISVSKAQEYRSQMYDWLEGFGLGFDRNDQSTWHVENLPPHEKGGMYRLAGVGHEQFAWDIRAETGVIDVFASIWNTRKLVASFDSINLALPLPEDQVKSKIPPWPHVDQSPLKRGLECVQGIVNLGDNGPDDGGLMVLEGSMPLYSQFLDERHTLGDPDPFNTDPKKDFWMHSKPELQWFLDHGCKWVKPCCEPGDLIVWDSRCVHYGSVPRGRPRCATYVCYKPVDTVPADKLVLKKEAFEKMQMTTHEPSTTNVVNPKAEWAGFRDKPLRAPVLSETALRLAGALAYE